MKRSQALVKVDWDKKRMPSIRRMEQLLVRAGYVPRSVEYRRSPSGTGWHVVFTVSPSPRSPYQVVALQLLLGGDVWREAVQLRRARAFGKAPAWMRDRWNVLYVKHPARQRKVKLEAFHPALGNPKDEKTVTYEDCRDLERPAYPPYASKKGKEMNPIRWFRRAMARRVIRERLASVAIEGVDAEVLIDWILSPGESKPCPICGCTADYCKTGYDHVGRLVRCDGKVLADNREGT